MGNTNSQQLQLDPEKYFLHRDRTWSHHQGHLIVPLTDAVIQRKMLRNTENGQILQNEGTISQRRRSMRHPDEGMFALSPSRRTLSDSDLSRAPFDHVMMPNMDSFTQKSVIAVSPSKAKIKLRKNKGKAPEPPGPPLPLPPPLDPRDVQRRFVRSNSSLCPRTWENEFNSLNLDRQPRCESRSRQQVPSKSRHSRPTAVESGQPSRRQDHNNNNNSNKMMANGSQKSVTSLNSHRSTPRSSAAPSASATSNKRTPNVKMSSGESGKPSKKATATDNSRPAPVKPQFYFSSMDALKKESPKAAAAAAANNNSIAHDKHPKTKSASSVTKPAPVKAAPAAAGAAAASCLLGKTQLNRVELTKPSSAKATTRADAERGRGSAAPTSREASKAANAKEPTAARTAALPLNNKLASSAAVAAVSSASALSSSSSSSSSLLSPLTSSSSSSSLPLTKKLPEIPLKVDSLPDRECSAAAKNAGLGRTGLTNLHPQSQPLPPLPLPPPPLPSHRNETNCVGVGIRPAQNDNVVFRVNPNFIVPSQCAPMPQTATQILDELDATLENYSQISTGRKSDDSDYCEPDDRELPPRASPNTQSTNAANVTQAGGVFAPQIPPPKSLEMLFRPPSPKALPPPSLPLPLPSLPLPPPSLPMMMMTTTTTSTLTTAAMTATRFNGLDITSQIELTSLPLADQPPTPPPIPSSWLKTRKNSSVASDDDDNDALHEINISVHLRPCLPRRPLLLSSMPSRFSPTHAWKSLDPAGSDGDHHDDKSLSDCELNFSSSSSSSDEDRKEESTLKAHLSVDSGITGGYSHPHPQWTPKEDLIDTDSESTGGHDVGLCSLPSQARFTLPSMFLQNSSGVDSNWSFKSGPNSLQQKSQSFVYLPPPKSADSTVHIIGHSSGHRAISTGGRNPSLSMGTWTTR